LSIADGEGHNSVWLAEAGLAVTVVEISGRRSKKPSGWPPEALVKAFDWTVAIFVQFVNPEERERQFSVMKQMPRPGGRILLQGNALTSLPM